MSSFEVLRELRVCKAKSSVLILSGLAGLEEKIKGLAFALTTA
jgi:DNA-binding response OmpR family regulator